MKAKNWYAGDTFQIKGQWFLPDQQDNLVGGILHYSPKEIFLELQGSLFDDFNDSSADIVLGNCENDMLVTLVKGIVVSQQVSVVQISNISFHQMLIGDHFSKQEDIEFKEINVKYNYLEEWIADSPFTYNTKKDNYELIHTKPEKSFSINVDSQNLKIEGDSSLSVKSISDFSPLLEHSNYIIYKTSDETTKNINWFLKIEPKFNGLMTFLMNRPVRKTQIIAKGLNVSEFKPVNDIFIFFRVDKLPPKKKIGHSELCIRLSDLENQLEEITNIWFDEKYSKPLINYLQNIYKGNSETVENFLRYTKVFESFHRETKNDAVYMPENEYKKIRRKMIDSVEDLIGEEFKEKLRNDLIRSYQFNFKKQLQYYLENMNETMKNIIFKDVSTERITQCITQTRNYHTHLGKKQSFAIEEGFDLLFLNLMLKTISFYWIAKELSFSEDYITSLISNNQNILMQLSEARKVLN